MLIDIWNERLLKQSRWFLILVLSGAIGAIALHAAGVRIALPLYWLLDRWHFHGDSWEPMRFALQDVRSGHAAQAYELVYARELKFQYPPSSLLVLSALDALGLNTQPNHNFNAVTWFAPFWVPLSILLAVPALSRLFLQPQTIDMPRIARHLGLGLAVLSVFFYPVIKAYTLGQMQTWLNSLFCMAVVAFVYNRGHLCGFFIGLICLVKPQFIVFMLWALVRGRRDVFTGIAIPFATGTAIALALYGVDMHLAYVQLLSRLSRIGESYFMNQSVNGLMHRLISQDDTNIFDSGKFPPYTPVVHIATLISSLLFTGLGLAFRATEDAGDRVLDLLMSALCFTLASPIAWEHHYGILPMVFTAMLFYAFGQHDRIQRLQDLKWLAGAAVASGFYLPALKRFGDPPYNLVQSLLFFGACASLALLMSMRRRRRAHPVRSYAEPVVSPVV